MYTKQKLNYNDKHWISTIFLEINNANIMLNVYEFIFRQMFIYLFYISDTYILVCLH